MMETYKIDTGKMKANWKKRNLIKRMEGLIAEILQVSGGELTKKDNGARYLRKKTFQGSPIHTIEL